MAHDSVVVGQKVDTTSSKVLSPVKLDTTTPFRVTPTIETKYVPANE